MSLRVGQFTASLVAPFGGAELYCLALARWLKAAGDDSVVVTGAIDDDLRHNLEAEGIEVVLVPRWRPYRAGRRGGRVSRLLFHALDVVQSRPSRKFEDAVEDAGLDVLHVHRWQGFGTGVLQGRRVPRVHTAHDFALVDTRSTLARAAGPLTMLPAAQRVRARVSGVSLCRGRTAVIFPTERTRQKHLEVGLGFSRNRTHVIWHGWEVQRGQANAELECAPKESVGRHAVLFLGSLSEAKGIPLLLGAWGEGIGDAELWVAGSGPLGPLVRSRADTVASIRFLGWANPALRAVLLARCALLVLPSDWPETFSLVSAEALLSGHPVVATVRSAPEILDASNSIVVEHTSAALRDGLAALLGDEIELAALSSSARRSSTAFAVPGHLTAVRDVYNETMKHS